MDTPSIGVAQRKLLRRAAPLALGLLAFGCGGGGGGGGAGGNFQVDAVNLQANSVWLVNRPITIRFSKPVDFTTVNLNSINIRQLSGTPALGEFSLADPFTVSFQPLCPRLADFSDAGLVPGGISYELRLLGNSAFSVRSTDGSILQTADQRVFSTPNSFDPAALFFDAVTGPPVPVVRSVTSIATDATHVEIGGDPNSRVYFERANNGVVSLENGFVLPLNLLSDATSSVAFLIAFNQPVDPSAQNLAPTRLRLEYFDQTGTWRTVDANLSLEANCSGTGALVRLEPIGSLPPDAQLRLFLAPEFRDLVGETNSVTQTQFAPAETQPVTGVLADSLEEEFLVGNPDPGSTEDPAPNTGLPVADWGNGAVSTAFDFDGTGGVNGTFDWEVKAGQVVILDTTVTAIVGGPGFVPSEQQIVVGGVVDVRNFRVAQGGTLKVQGPNPMTLLASGTVEINGLIEISGADSRGVGSLGTTNIPEPGSTGIAGGGKGGTGSPLTNASSPRGGPGSGAFNQPDLGGQGGETTFWTGGGGSVDARRGTGGGGGRFGPDQFAAGSSTILDQKFIGLDAEKGFNNLFVPVGTQPAPIGAVTGQAPPLGGAVGPSPFVDPFSNNDFYGRSFDSTTGTITTGELTQPWAGAGGGGGGDAAFSNGAPFPVVPFDPSGDEKGAGGGGGGGSMQVLALGTIKFGSVGVIRCRGGTGGGGENTNFVDRVGGGSGGASGGHVVLQTAAKIDFTSATSTTQVSIFTTGGQGGAGKDDIGGAKIGQAGAQETVPNADACPVNTTQQPCLGPISGAGGDGSPGLIQLHTPNGLGGGDILLPAGRTLADLCKPTPINATATVRMLPTFGRASVARSIWVPMGLAGLDPNAVAAPFFKPSTLDFGGIDTVTGQVNVTGGVVDLGPVLLGPATVGVAPTLPNILPSGRTIVMDATPLIGGPQEYFLSNPGLLKRATLLLNQVGNPANNQRFDIATAVYVSTSVPPTLQLTMVSSDPLLTSFAAGGGVEASVIPTYFKIVTNGVKDALPSSAAVYLKFQAAPATAAGVPDTALAVPPIPGSDISVLNADLNNANFRFLRFQIEFDIDTLGAGITPATPLPGVDFLRLPYRY